MRFGILGPLQLEVEEQAATLSGNRQRAVLAVLLVAAGRSVTADRLIDQVWGRDMPANPANTLQHTIAQIRKVLEPGRSRSDEPQILCSTDDGYRLKLDGHEVDATEFEAHMAAASGALAEQRPTAALESVESALALWRGPALTEFDGVEAAEAEAHRLSERRIDAEILAIDARTAVQGPQAVIADLEGLIVEQPHREGLWARLMTALYQVDRQADALRTYRRAADTLADELGLSPSTALQDLEQRILQHDPALRPAITVAHNLPAMTSTLVGRRGLLELVPDTLAQHRLVTLLGPGGAGKTRLAVEVGRMLVEANGGTPNTVSPATGAAGVWLVRLDDMGDPSLLATAIATTMGMAESPKGEVAATLAAHVGERPVLLILDNCEHLVDEVGSLVAQLLTRCPGLAVLATSQAPLEVTAEQRIPVPPLGLPADAGSPFAQLDESPAVQLFLERASAVDVTRTFDEHELAATANIVRALDGNPLAIELAAARTDMYSPSEIARLLADRFDVLDGGPRDAPARQRTLRSALEWSIGLLDEDEAQFFTHISVFVGGFDLEAAVRLTGRSEVEVRRLVAGLVSRSFIQRQPGDQPRFRLLETVRQFGQVLRTESGADGDIARRHALLFADRACELEQALGGHRQAEAFHTYVLDADNFRAAMAWSLGAGADRIEDLPAGVRIAARHGRFWDWRGSLAEANTWLTRFIDAAPIEADIPDIALLQSWRSFFTAELGDREAAEVISTTAIATALAGDDRYSLAVANSGPAMYARLAGRYDEALELNDHLRRLSEEIDEPWMIGWAYNHDALVLLAMGRAVEAAEAARRCHQIFLAEGDQRAQAWALTAMAQIELESGRGEEARRLSNEAMALSIEAGDGRNAAWAAELAAAAHRALDETDTAETLEAQAAELLSARGMPLSPWRREGR